MLPNLKTFSEEWIASWNSHKIERILDHYAEDVEVTSPMIKVTMGINDGAIKGKAEAGRYWQAALKKVPELHFELFDCTQSVNSVALYYKSVFGKMAIEVMFFDSKGKVSKVIAHYN